MSASCFYKIYTGVELNYNSAEKTSKDAEKPSANKNGTRGVKTGVDGIDIHLVSSLRPRDMPLPPPITDSQYNRLYDSRYGTDREFVATQLELWRIRLARLAPLTSYERNCLISRWFVHANNFSHAGRPATVTSHSATPSAGGANNQGVTMSKNDERPTGFQVGNLCKPSEPSCDNAAVFFNSEGRLDSRCCPELIAMWEMRANRKRPFPRAVADKLLAAWLRHESTWTPCERIIFYADHDPAVEGGALISPDRKQRLLDKLVPRNADGSEPLLNGRNVRGCKPTLSPDEPAEKVLATSLGAKSVRTPSAYEKELKQFLAANSEANVIRFARSAKAAASRYHQLGIVMKSELPMDVESQRQMLCPSVRV